MSILKRILILLLSFTLLTGCSSKKTINEAISLRQKLLESNGCSFTTDITADYGDEIYTFCMQCVSDNSGNIVFTVTKPASISGISGQISEDGGRLTFDEHVLGFPLLVDEQFSPVSAPWLFVKTLQSGYIHSACPTKDGTYVCIDDSFADDALQVNIWLDDMNRPTTAEFFWRNRRILSMQINGFSFL